MSTIPKPKYDVKQRQWKVKIGERNLLLTEQDTPDSILIYAGGRSVYCIHVQLIKPESRVAQYCDPTIGTLTKLAFNTECSLEYNFQRGIDTQMIVTFMLSYIRSKYPRITGLRFTDASRRDCGNGNVVDLAPLSYLTLGKTWYERTFGAYLEEQYVSRFQQLHEQFQRLKSVVKWEDINNTYIRDDKYRSLFESTSTWQEFFSKIRDSMGAADFCAFVSPWLIAFMSVYMSFPFPGVSYIIPITNSSINTIEYSLEPYIPQQNGGTRKRIKKRATPAI
jgi:hypothetical protein